MDKDTLNRRDFFRAAGVGVTAATVLVTPREAALAQAAAEKAALDRIASNSYPIRPLFKQRGGPGGRGGGAPVPSGDSAGRGAGQPPQGRGAGAADAPDL